jgi:hypothetical protein
VSRTYATGTDVPVQRSRAHLEDLLRAHGAEGFAFGWTSDFDRVEFVLHNRRIRFVLPRPKKDKFKLTPSGLLRTDKQIQAAVDAEDRRRWRALLLIVRAKVEAVESGIASFEEEFLAFIVMPNDQTIGDILLPQIEAGTIARKLLPPSQQPQ